MVVLGLRRTLRQAGMTPEPKSYPTLLKRSDEEAVSGTSLPGCLIKIGGVARSRAAICLRVGLGELLALSDGFLGVSLGRCENSEDARLVELRESSIDSRSLGSWFSVLIGWPRREKGEQTSLKVLVMAHAIGSMSDGGMRAIQSSSS